MAFQGKRVREIELKQSREPGRETEGSFILLRETEWGARNGEVLLHFYWDDPESDGMQGYRNEISGALDKEALFSLAYAALTMAGEKDIAKQIAIPDRVQSVKGD